MTDSAEPAIACSGVLTTLVWGCHTQSQRHLTPADIHHKAKTQHAHLGLATITER